jgi:hypothetical protein
MSRGSLEQCQIVLINAGRSLIRLTLWLPMRPPKKSASRALFTIGLIALVAMLVVMLLTLLMLFVMTAMVPTIILIAIAGDVST